MGGMEGHGWEGGEGWTWLGGMEGHGWEGHGWEGHGWEGWRDIWLGGMEPMKGHMVWRDMVGREGHMGGRDGWTHGKEAHMYGVEGNTHGSKGHLGGMDTWGLRSCGPHFLRCAELPLAIGSAGICTAGTDMHCVS